MKNFLLKLTLQFCLFNSAFAQVTISGTQEVATGQTHTITLTQATTVTSISVVGSGTTLTINGVFNYTNSDSTKGTILNGGTINGTGYLTTKFIDVSGTYSLNIRQVNIQQVQTDALTFGTGANTLYLSGGGSGAIDMGGGNDSVFISSTCTGNIDGGTGTDTLYLNGGTVSGTLTNFENLTVLWHSTINSNLTVRGNTSLMQSNLLGTGHLSTSKISGVGTLKLAQITLTGSQIETLIFGTGANSLTLSGGGSGVMNMFGGNDTVTVSSAYTGNINGGAGTDTLRLKGATVSGMLSNFEKFEVGLGTSILDEDLTLTGNVTISGTLQIAMGHTLTTGSGAGVSNQVQSGGTLDISQLANDTAGIGSNGITIVAGGTLALGTAKSRNTSNITLTRGATTSTSSKISLDLGTSASTSTTAIFSTLPSLTGTGKVTLEISGSLSSGATQVLASGDVTGDYRISSGAFKLYYYETNTIILQNVAPVISGGTSFSVAENQTSAFTVVASDGNNDTLNYTLSGVDANLFSVNSNGVVTFKIAPNFESAGDSDTNNIYQVTVKVDDGQSPKLSDTQSYTVRVTNVNEAPTVSSAIDDVTYAENASISLDVSSHFNDVDTGTSLTFTAVGLPTGLTMNTAGVISGSVTDDDQVGDHTVQITASDGSLEVTDTFTLTITNVNEAPTVASSIDDVSYAENASISLDVSSHFNDVDTGTTLTFTAVGLPTGLTMNTAGVISGSVTDDDQVGDHTVQITASDGSLRVSDTFTLTITNVNDAPVISTSSQNFNVNENQTTVFTVSASDDDTGSTLTYSLEGVDASLFNIVSTTGVITFKTAPDYENAGDSNTDNIYNIIVRVSDGTLSDTQSFTVRVTNVNEAPTVASTIDDVSYAENALISLDVSSSFNDVDTGTTLTFTAVGLPTGLTMNTAGVISGSVTDDDQVGDHTVQVTASDGSLSVSDTFTLTITNVNEAPTVNRATGIETFAENADISLSVTKLFDDVDSTLTYRASGLPTGLVIDTNTGIISGSVTDDSQIGDYTIIVIASDGSLSARGTFRLRITNVNDAPVITTSGNFNVNEGQGRTVVGEIEATDADTGATSTYSLEGTDASLFNIGSSTGVITFKQTPDFENSQDDNGDNIYDITVRVSDGELSDTQSYTVTVQNVNEVPVISTSGGTNFNVQENQMGVGTIQATDLDASTTLTYSLEGTDARFFNIGSSTGILSFIRAMDFESPQDSDSNNVYEITVKVSDGELSDTRFFTVTVTDVNETPAIIERRIVVLGQIKDIPLKDLAGTTTGVLEAQTALAEIEASSLSNAGRDFLNKVAALKPQEVARSIAKIIPTEAVSSVTSGITTVATTTNSAIGTRTVNLATGQTQGVRGAMDREGQILGYNVWADFSMGFGGLDEDDNSKGYDFSSYATRIGLDKHYAEAILGLAFSYSTMSLEPQEAGESDLNTFGLTFYGSYTGLENYRIDSLVGFSSNDIDLSARQAGITGATSGNTTSDVIDLDITVHFLSYKDFTSFIGLRYISNDVSSYSLKGALPMSVAGKAYNSFFVKFGTRCDYYWKGAKHTHNVGLKTSFYYNSSDTERVTSATFVGGTKPFEVRGVEEDKLSLGFGVDYSLQADKMTWVFGYDLVFGQKGNSHSINVKGSWDF